MEEEEGAAAAAANGGAEPASEEEEFLPGHQTLQDYSKALLKEVVKATKVANSLPEEGDDFDYYSSFPGFRIFCQKMGSRVTKSISRLIRHQSLPCYWPPPSLAPPTQNEQEEAGLVAMVEERMEAIIEANDVLLERVGVLMDEACGLKRKREEVVLQPQLQQGTAEVASWNRQSSVRKNKGKLQFMASRNVPRPQVRFRDQVDNSSNSPFVPRLRSKPNARQPLPDVFQRLQNPQSLEALISNSKEWAMVKNNYTHPYQFELKNFVPTKDQLQLSEPQAPGTLEEVPYHFIDNEEQLKALAEELSQCSEFAIDLEHHSYRSFQGFVCLMQISTRSHDYIIDTIELRHAIHCLLEPFTDPSIVKVMHGAEWDILWLQRDFGLYVVNLFDTGQASHVLQLPKHSLAFLLHYCCGVEADKQYQLADWRIRPLPPEMEKYAREDTHYLLYIYDRMRNELIRRKTGAIDPLQSTLVQSRDVCLRTYQKPAFREDDYLKLYNRHKRSFNSQQLHCLKLLFEWRDRVAREEDESTGYVLPNHMMFQISEQLPREAQGVLACCVPVPTLLRQQLQEVFLLVQQARDTPLSQKLPELKVTPASTLATPTTTPTTSTLLLDTWSPQTSSAPHSEPLTETDQRRHVVELRGPPVPSATPAMSAFEGVSWKVSERVREQLEQIEASFPDVLAKFLQPISSPLTPAPAETAVQPEPSMAGSSHAVTDSQPTAAPETSDRKEGRRSKKRKKLSVREMGGDKRRKVSPPTASDDEKEEGELGDEDNDDDGDGDEVVVKKKAKLTDTEDGGLTPFNYDGAQITDFPQGVSYAPPVVFQPNSATLRGSKRGGAKSRVHMKSGERSHTHHSRQSSSSSALKFWPKKD